MDLELSLFHKIHWKCKTFWFFFIFLTCRYKEQKGSSPRLSSLLVKVDWHTIVVDTVSQLKFNCYLVSSASLPSVLVTSCVVGLSRRLLPVSRCVSSRSSSAASDWSALPSLVPAGSPVFAVTAVLWAAHFLSVCLCDVLLIYTDK